MYSCRYESRSPLLNAIQNLAYSKGKTNTADGLRIVDEMIFTEEGGDRSNIANVLIIITDGQSNVNVTETIPTAKKLRDQKDVIIFTVGVTDLISEEELKGMSSEPQEPTVNYFVTADFNQLEDVLEVIVNGTCEAAESGV